MWTCNNQSQGGTFQIISMMIFSVAPVCTTPPHLYGLSVGDAADIPCNVAANPTQVISSSYVYHMYSSAELTPCGLAWMDN